MAFPRFEIEFTKLLNKCGMSNGLKVHHLRNKINDELRKALIYWEYPGEEDYTGWL